MEITRAFAFALAAAWLAWAGPLHAECVSAPEPEDEAIAATAFNDTEAGASLRDRRGRVVAPIHVNGEGPFRFIVDTGANRSVLSPGLADRLGLVPIGEGQVHSIDGVETAPMVQIDSLTYGRLTFPSAGMPVLHGRMLAGEAGLLGVDGMQGRRLRMDFERRCIEIVPSRGARRLRGWETIQGELRFGHLVVVRGRIRDVAVNVLIDTGSDSSMANSALRTALGDIQVQQDYYQIGRAYTAGRPIVLDRVILIPRLRLGDIEIDRVAAFVGDYHIFRLWGFENEPTLLVGMDVLREARGIAIDYERATVSFNLPPGSLLY
jgi:predicted aspartyl protease